MPRAGASRRRGHGRGATGARPGTGEAQALRAARGSPSARSRRRSPPGRARSQRFALRTPDARPTGADGHVVLNCNRAPFPSGGADRADPLLGDRRRRRPPGAVRTTTDRVRRRDRLGPLVGVRRGLHPRLGAAGVRKHAHRGVGDRASHDGAARGSTRSDSPRRERRQRGRGPVLRLRRDRGDRQIDAAAGADRRRSAGGVHRTVRAPLKRAAMAGIPGRPDHDRRRPRRSYRCRSSRLRAATPRRSRGEDRELLGRVERDGRDHRRRRDRDHAASARRGVLLGLRGGGPLPTDRHEPGARPCRRRARVQGRGLRLARTSSSAAPGRPACSW